MQNIARRVSHILPKQFIQEYSKIEKKISYMTKKELIDILKTNEDVELVSPSTILVRAREDVLALESGKLPPSIFPRYRHCARRLVIELIEAKRQGGFLLSVEQAKSIVKGILIHRLFTSYALGDVEVQVESSRFKGIVDEVRFYPNRVSVIEFKSSRKLDLVGASLQVMAYMESFIEQGISVEGYVVNPWETYIVTYNRDILDEYYRRVTTIISRAIENTEYLPPRLSGRLSHRCHYCSYRLKCLKLPDKHKSYEVYFRVMGFKFLRESSPKKSLEEFLS